MYRRFALFFLPLCLLVVGDCRRDSDFLTREEKYPNGQLKSRQTYKVEFDDTEVLAGPATFWFADGTLQAKGGYVKGKRHGKWTYWYASGQMKSQGEYAHGRKNGEWSDWEKDSNRQKLTRYANGKKVD